MSTATPSTTPALPALSFPTLKWIATACVTIGASLGLAYLVKDALKGSPPCQDDTFIAKHSKTHQIRGKQLRVVFVEHKLGRELPAIVFVHGMGAQLQQWNEQLLHFSHIANVLSLDIVGHGRSERVPSKDAYSTESIVEDLVALLEIYRYKAESFILVGHSYGCNLITWTYPKIAKLTKAMVLICPKSRPTKSERDKLKKFVAAPVLVIDVLRLMDRKGGINSPSVNRLVSRGASESLRKKQLGWNSAHSTRIAQMVFEGANFATPEMYDSIDCPVLLIGGEEDLVCPVKANLEVVHSWLTSSTNVVAEPFVIPNAAHQVMLEQPDVVNAIIYNWLIECGFSKMNLTTQLQTKNPSASKWSLKNYAKWQKVAPVAAFPVKTSLFRPMKTMKQDDPSHTPQIFAKRHPEIGVVLDISHDAPPYAIEDFVGTSCTYQKLATTSKIPPTREEVARFSEAVMAFWKEHPDSHIGVHCHYGFNRTGFMICSYLIERNGCNVRQAIDYFAEARPPGIRHIHFKDELYIRYAAPGMRSPNKKR
ncbi:hypothetical protein PhCBS80983_g02764 [Powellomyces hirtus]|uniref:Tyrosine specific protein phosphatases domain-containing protein n=1 Tax=Powellomyces hirtus TaxID=109895 RepID=A0A507E5H9_9FUNG|nr:hypothetical protein PhCBS80983_g02764 [Powellomyces hirtus]